MHRRGAGLLAESGVGKDEGSHGFDDWHSTWHYAWVVTALGRKRDTLAFEIDRFLFLANSGRGLECQFE